MDRRRVLKAGVGACVGFTLAGCVDDEEGTAETETTTSSGDPEEVMQQFFDAIAAGDHDTVESLVHPDGELADVADELPSDEDAIEYESIHTETVAQGDGKAFVETEVREQYTDGEERTNEDLFELHREGGDWRIYARPNNVPLKLRLEDVTAAESFETTIGTSESAAEFFFSAKEAAAVDIQDHYQDDDIVLVSLSFPDDKADQMQQTAADLGSDLQDAQTFEYLEDELVRTSDVSEGLAQTMQTGNWDGMFNVSYTDRDLAERVAKTVLTQVDD